ncbi:RHO1 GDP-GTP exchange protein 2 [Coemansia nantahalensis]|nr:RHO1 GDP-GTP exchange protein 2 [Coemansia nantahalensis]
MGAPLVVLMKVRGGKSHFKCIQPLPNPDEPPAAAEPGAASPSASIKSDDDNVASSASSSTRHARRRETISEPPPAAPATEAGAPQRVVYQGPDAQLRLIGEFVVAGKTKRVHFLRRKLCIVGARSFEIVDVQQGRVLRSLPDPLDDDFSFLHALDCGQAMAICKVGREFLLCYEAFAFFIDNFGRRSRLDVFIRWEMRPQLITFRHPYIVAVNPRFIEVRHIETGVLLSIIRIRGALCLNPDSRSTILHLAIGPEPQGIPAPAPAATASPQPQQAGPVPLPSEPETPRPLSVAAAALAKPAAAALAAGHVVPGIAGTTGKSLFPEAIPGHYRIVEVRLPPLKPSAKSATPAS